MLPKRVEVVIGELLQAQGLHLAVAESCTGGLIGHWITNVPGASAYFYGGVIVYANEAKVDQVGVRLETLLKYGAVSAEAVLEMASGVRRVFKAEIGLAVTGIAGPGGGTEVKPVGFTWIGISTPADQLTWNFVFPGDRLAVKAQSAEKALRLLEDYLRRF